MSPGVDLEELVFSTASEAAEAIQSGKVTSLRLTEHMLNRIQRFNPEINSIVSLMAEQALVRAREADRALSTGVVWGPLHGVPITVKDHYEIAGVVTTCGSPDYADYVPERNAVVVQRLLDAGAVILGHTNVPCLAADWQSYNEVYGTTVNPWNNEVTPGGSSGGCVASLATGLSFLSVGSDFAGSIRVPSHFCGVYGHRPSIGTAPLRGSVPGSMNCVHRPPSRMSTPGPMARSPEDLRLAMEVIGGPDEYESRAYKWCMPEPRHMRLDEYRIGYVIDEPLCALNPDIQSVLRDALSQLSESVASAKEGWPTKVDPAEQYHLFKLLRYADKAAQLKDENLADTKELAKRKDVDDEGLMAWVWTTEQREHMRFEEMRIATRDLWQRVFNDIDVFLMPVDYTAAFPHDHSDPMTKRTIDTKWGTRQYMDQLFWMTFSSITGLPCTVAPVGFTDSGLPVGVQIMGPYLEDGTTIQFAKLMSEIVGGYVEPPGFRL
jgi:amidase